MEAEMSCEQNGTDGARNDWVYKEEFGENSWVASLGAKIRFSKNEIDFGPSDELHRGGRSRVF